MSAAHLSSEDLEAFAGRRLDAPRVQTIFAHLSTCALCRETWQQALETDRSTERILDEVAPVQRRAPRRRFILALAASLAIAVIGAIFVLLKSNINRAPKVVQTTTTTAEPTTLTTVSASSIETQIQPEPRLHPVVAAALERGVLEPPPAFAALLALPSAEHVRGTNATEHATYEPNRVVVASQRPQFRFPNERGVPTVVRVFDRDREIVHSEPVDTGEWTPRVDLPRGVTYTWQVESTRDGHTVIAPAPPAPPARFIVVDADSHRALETARRDDPDDHLLLGVLSARAGLRDEAEKELGIAARSGDRRAAELLRSVRSWRR